MKNQVIEVLDKAYGSRVIEYWQSKGVDTRGMSGSFTKENGESARYYGVINDMFDYYSISFVRKHKAEIIELPIENSRQFPKLMIVSMFPLWNYYQDGNSAHCSQTRVVVAAGSGYAVGVDYCESLDDYIKRQKENKLSYTLWKYHQEIPNKIIISKAEIAEKFGVPFDYIKIVD